MKCNIPLNDLSQRLHETVCRYDGQPVRIKCEHGSPILHMFNLTGSKHLGDTQADDPSLDISSVPLGYVQLAPDVVAYTKRRPARIYKQGINNDSVVWEFLTKANSLLARANVFSKEFEKMVSGIYPSLDQAMDLIKIPNTRSPVSEIAVSRDIAMKYDHEMQFTHVYYKGMKVGYIVKDERTVITPSNEMGWVISRFLSHFDWKVE